MLSAELGFAYKNRSLHPHVQKDRKQNVVKVVCGKALPSGMPRGNGFFLGSVTVGWIWS